MRKTNDTKTVLLRLAIVVIACALGAGAMALTQTLWAGAAVLAIMMFVLNLT